MMRAEVFREKVMVGIAWSMPRWLVFWCAIRLGAHATTGEHSSQDTNELSFSDALKRW